MKSNEHLRYLFDRYINKTCTAAEKQELIELLADPSYEAQWKVINEAYEEIPASGETLSESHTMAVWEAVRERTVAEKQPAILRPFFRRWWAAAAVALVLAGAATWFWVDAGRDDTRAKLMAKETSPILPGEAGAFLKLDDGRMIVLDTAQNGLVASNAAANVVVENGSLKYQPREGAAAAGNVYNTMVTMRGKMYRMILPDGTRVWLNASTQFRYPIAFNGTERRVQLSGEAYFEVAENPSRPFIVEVEKRGEVKVLGTHFNVHAYTEEDAFTTTLLEGKVQVSSGYKDWMGRDQRVTLKPSEQAVIGEKKDMIVRMADLEQVVAWKNGKFVFKSADLKDVFSQVARWYDVNFITGDDIDAVFSGSMYRTEDFHQLLKLMEFTTGLNFRVEGRKVYVTRKK